MMFAYMFVNTTFGNESLLTYLRWRVHEIELQQVLDTQRLQQQYGICQVCPLDLRYGVGKHFVSVGHLCIQAVAEAMKGCQKSFQPIYS